VKRILVTLIVVIADQLSKVAIKSSELYGVSQPFLGDFVRLTFLENPGLAFGVSIGGFGWLLFLVTIFITAYIIYYLFSDTILIPGERLSLNFILGGAIGNLIDRGFTIFNLFEYRGVIDFIDLGITGIYRWPYIFNLADMSVTIGIIIFIISTYLHNNQEANNYEVN
tara:strand:+ start:3970 stop:4473 length:504 start_codon:yes stop_codon:yes gene_type:complete